MNTRLCKICNQSFIPKQSRQLYCKREIILKCPVCGDDFVTYCQPDNPTTCSKPECKKKAGYIGSIKKEKKCKMCGSVFKPMSSTQECCNKPITRICACCGKEFTIKCTAQEYYKQTCSEECKNKIASQHRQQTYTKTTRICEFCGKEFHPRSNTQRICDDQHFRECIVCGKKFPLIYKPNANLWDLRKTCSEECFRKQFEGNNPFADPASLEKYKQTSLERYGSLHPMQAEHIKKKVFATYKENTGYDHPSHNPNTFIGRQSNVSSLEMKVSNVLLNNLIKFECQKQLSKEGISHKFDFYLPDYNIYVDVDGEYYHGYLDDSNGEQVSEDRDNIRAYLIERPSIYIVLTKRNLNNELDDLLATIKSIDSNTYDYEKQMFEWCRSIDFPYPIYEPDRLKRDYSNLCKYQCSKYNPHAKLGISTIRHFHKSIYDAHVGRSKSIKEAWNDDDTLRKVIKNRMIYQNNVDPSKILAGFYISKIIPKVSVFNSVLARYICLKYLKDYNEVVDPFSGFSGRLLGVTSTGKKYIGSDFNETAVKESNAIIEFHNLNASVYQSDVTKLNDDMHFECLLTCPPYYTKETYSTETIFKSCDDWIDLILNKYHCNRYVFVVDSVNQYSDYISEDIVTKSHFTTTFEHIVVIDK